MEIMPPEVSIMRPEDCIMLPEGCRRHQAGQWEVEVAKQQILWTLSLKSPRLVTPSGGKVSRADVTQDCKSGARGISNRRSLWIVPCDLVMTCAANYSRDDWRSGGTAKSKRLSFIRISMDVLLNFSVLHWAD